MSERGPRYPKEEFARRGESIYAEQIKNQVEPEHHGKYILIDIETGEYEIDIDSLQALDRLYARIPSAQPWRRRIGYRTASRSLSLHSLKSHE